MSVSVFARGRDKPELRVFDEATQSVHRVREMYIYTEQPVDERPYGAECGWLVTGCKEVDAPVDCLECIAGADVLIAALHEKYAK